MFDKHSRQLTLLRTFSNSSTIVSSCRAVCIGNYVIVFFGISSNKSNKTEMYMYHVDKQVWSGVDCSFCKNLYGSNCVKYHTQ